MSSTASKGSGIPAPSQGTSSSVAGRSLRRPDAPKLAESLQGILLNLKHRDVKLNVIKSLSAKDQAKKPSPRAEHLEVFVGEANALELHNMVRDGIATKDLLEMLARFDAIPKQKLLSALDVSERTLQRHRDGRLGAVIASVALDLASITEQAESVLGSMAEAQRWLTTGAVALRGSTPLELLSTRQGADLVRDLLVRMEYGVYA